MKISKFCCRLIENVGVKLSYFVEAHGWHCQGKGCVTYGGMAWHGSLQESLHTFSPTKTVILTFVKVIWGEFRNSAGQFTIHPQDLVAFHMNMRQIIRFCFLILVQYCHDCNLPYYVKKRKMGDFTQHSFLLSWFTISKCSS